MGRAEISGLRVLMPGINLPFHHKAKIGSDQKDESWYETGLVQRAGPEACRSEILRATHMKVLKAQLRHPPGKDHVVKPGKGRAVFDRALTERSPWIFMPAPDKATG